MRYRGIVALVLVATAGAPAAATASPLSLYTGPGPRPGPALLYAKPFVAPQLTNIAPWKAKPILVSGATAYRGGEFLYQDYLYDDNGARLTPDPNDPRAAGNLFSKQNGTYTYPTDRRYANNAADLVELRVRPLADATAFRLTLNTMKDPSLAAFTIAIGGKPGEKFEFPHGANVKAPAALFLTVHAGKSGMVAELVRAKTGKPVTGGTPTAGIDPERRQIVVTVPHSAWNPGSRVVRLAAGVGLWDKASNSYLVPQPAADATHPGGGGGSSSPAAFFNVAFRTREPMQTPTEGLAVVTNGAWWRDRHQGTALAANDISHQYNNVNFGMLRQHANDERDVPKHGPMDRILSTHFELSQGADFGPSCFTAPENCPGQYQGRLQPYAIYIPKKPRPSKGYGMTLLLHSLSANYNQYLASRNMRQFAERSKGSIVITTESRGPDENYENYGAADVFDAWADVAHRYRLDPSWTVIAGYSMGGIGTFKLGAQFPDLFARAQPTVGDESSEEVLASLRNVPVLMWNNHGDELVNEASFEQTANALDSLGYRYELDAYQPCSNFTGNPMCSPVIPNHLQLAINDQYKPAAAFLDSVHVHRNPPHVTYVVDPSRNHAKLGVVGNHAYWVAKIKPRDASSTAQLDAFSHGFGVGDPPASGTQVGSGTLMGGNLGPIAFTSQRKTWGKAPSKPVANSVDVDATNVKSASINLRRAHLGCNAKVNVTTDGPIEISFPGCGRKLGVASATGPR